MGVTSRKKRQIDRRRVSFRDAKLVVIATEGRITEKQYFSGFKKKRVQVEIITNHEDKSSPKHILERLNDYFEEYQIGEEDQLWLMIDVDNWKEKTLSFVTTEAFKKGYGLAISNPCFEVWLYLHFDDLNPDQSIKSKQMVAELRKKAGSYNKTNLDTQKYLPLVSNAIERAKKLDSNPQDRWPLTIGTHVYKVVEIIESLD